MIKLICSASLAWWGGWGYIRKHPFFFPPKRTTITTDFCEWWAFNS